MTKPLGMELGSNILHQLIKCLEFPLHIFFESNSDGTVKRGLEGRPLHIYILQIFKARNFE